MCEGLIPVYRISGCTDPSRRGPVPTGDNRTWTNVQPNWNANAARGGSQSRGFLYSGSTDVSQVAWYDGNSNTVAQPVAMKQPNKIRLYDLSGSVWERL
ncbi:MAG: formylglycine-generating enzyme family protein [Spirochaetales bacterium]|nr:formylglycine-generating enzyme family protein [Spirochaetales bacterium]